MTTNIQNNGYSHTNMQSNIWAIDIDSLTCSNKKERLMKVIRNDGMITIEYSNHFYNLKMFKGITPISIMIKEGLTINTYENFATAQKDSTSTKVIKTMNNKSNQIIKGFRFTIHFATDIILDYVNDSFLDTVNDYNSIVSILLGYEIEDFDYIVKQARQMGLDISTEILKLRG